MYEPLPVRYFRWISGFNNRQDIPCILEVDLQYPKELHDLQKDYPLAAERFIFNGIEKLIPNLSDKERYRAHHKTLKQYLNLGLRIKKIHRGISFEEEPWLGSYSEFHTKLRANAKNDFEKDFSKLMNNLSSEKTWKMTERKH